MLGRNYGRSRENRTPTRKLQRNYGQDRENRNLIRNSQLKLRIKKIQILPVTGRAILALCQENMFRYGLYLKKYNPESKKRKKELAENRHFDYTC